MTILKQLKQSSSYLSPIFGLSISTIILVCAFYYAQCTETQIKQQFYSKHLNQISIVIYHPPQTGLIQPFYQHLQASKDFKNLSLISHRRVQINQQPLQIIASDAPVIHGKVIQGRHLHENDLKPYAVIYGQTPKHLPLTIDIENITLIPIGRAELTKAPHAISHQAPILEVSEKTYQRIFGIHHHNVIVLESKNPKKTEDHTKAISDIAKKYSLQHLQITSPSMLIKKQLKSISLVQNVLYVFCALILILSTALLTQQNRLSYLQRRSDFALKMALGATKQKILIQLILESGMHVVISTILTFITSCWIISWIAYSHTWAFYIPLPAFMITTVINFAISIIGTLIPAKQYFSIPIAKILKGA
jgi:hypothetical protein